MNTMTKEDYEQLEFNYFYWLGDDGETEPVSEQEFLQRQNKLRLDRDNFLNVRVQDDDVE